MASENSLAANPATLAAAEDDPACVGCHSEQAGPSGTQRLTLRPAKTKLDLMSRLKRIEGQVRGVTRMVEEDIYCDDIIHQISAIQAALGSVERQLLENHLRGCLVQRIQAGETEVIDELLVTVKAMLR